MVDEQAGDGTALYDITGSGSTDVVTATGFYENTRGDGSSWTFRPFVELIDLRVDVETRVAVGDLLGDGSVCVVIAESELLQHARLLVVHSADGGASWTVHTLIGARHDLGALHTLQIVDSVGEVNSGGLPGIFVAEMELYRTDVDFARRPTWRLLRNLGGLQFDEQVVLDANLGAHMGAAGHISDPSRTDFVAKNWSANADNDCDGLNHVVHIYSPEIAG